MKMANEKTLYEFSVLRERKNYIYKFYVLAVNKEEATRKFLNKYPDLRNFRITYPITNF